MAIDKDPSIFTDRSTIGSSDELDEYGVWVKSEPKDVSDVKKTENNAESTKMIDDSFEPSLPDIEDLPDLEMDTLPDIELTNDSRSEVTNTTDASIQDFGNLPEPEDFSVEELPQAVNSSDTFEELTSFDVVDFTSIEDRPKTSEPVLENKKEEIGLETESFIPEEDNLPASNTDEFTELSMDDFLDTNDFDTTSVAEQEQVEEESFDIDLEFNESVDLNMMNAESAMDIGTVSEAKDSDLNLESVSDFDDFLSDLGEASEDDSQEKNPSTSDKSTITHENTADFNDVEAVHHELEAATVVPETLQQPQIATQHENSESSVDLSTQLLMKIADELSTIKKELSTLKEELATYKNKPSINEETKSSSEEKQKGFFDDEEDEKIALTGDELDNILNTAEFTEEAGPEITDNFEESELLSEKEDLISDESAEIDEIPNPIPETTIETGVSGSADLNTDVIKATFSDEITSKTPIEEGLGEEAIELPVDESIAELQEEGVKPIIEAPEDLEYLAEDLNEISLHSEELHDSPQLDLSEAVIEEPDLSGVVLEEQPLEEPAIEDIHIELDTSEGSEVESPLAFETETLQNLEELEDISTPIQEESFEEVLPEGFVVEPEEAEPIDTSKTPLEEEVLEAIPEETLANQEIEPEVVQPKEKIVGSPNLTQEIKAVLSYMDQLLESLPEEKIEEFAKSEYFETYKKLFEELGLV
ncbi:hypothetical protein [Gracilinema caldarium]|uniref:Uncharacterized protein n=1 Tax=Gracilinema caldarium (strain ATCC 51460 / DSM 7334 / H1) TaxID=744872 RepID=F8F2P7_GRAC1|nr:hypothetical protein [Gracilinema caldarium]AEJ19441.1 hypothetical protein Spica_1295 [Gracilinema caldarium DSM 7334]